MGFFDVLKAAKVSSKVRAQADRNRARLRAVGRSGDWKPKQKFSPTKTALYAVGAVIMAKALFRGWGED